MVSLAKETLELEAELTTASDPSVDASKLPVGTEIEPVLALKEILTLASKDFPTKHAFFVMTASGLQVPAERGHMRLKVNRVSLFEDWMKSLAAIPPQKLRSMLRIDFVGESGVDTGGLHREWFCDSHRPAGCSRSWTLRLQRQEPASLLPESMFRWRSLAHATAPPLCDGSFA
jgi:hypothetical protein